MKIYLWIPQVYCEIYHPFLLIETLNILQSGPLNSLRSAHFIHAILTGFVVHQQHEKYSLLTFTKQIVGTNIKNLHFGIYAFVSVLINY